MEEKGYSAIAVANEFLDIAEKESKWITPLKLQKLVYIAHGWCLGLLDKPLIDESIEAWEFGPVVPSVYHKFKSFGNKPITEKGYINEYMGLKKNTPRIDVNDKTMKLFMDKVWEVYGKYDAWSLSSLTHQPDTPWHLANSQHNYFIHDDIIKSYYEKLAEENEAAE